MKNHKTHLNTAVMRHGRSIICRRIFEVALATLLLTALALILAVFINPPPEQTVRGDFQISIYRPRPLPEIFDRAIPHLPGSWQQRLLAPGSQLVVKRGWRTVLKQRAFLFQISTNSNGLPIPSDLTGDGVPDVAIISYSGGAHCCFTLNIYSCGESFKRVASIDLQHGEAAFKDLDNDGIPEIRINDWTFQYWPGGFASSPAPNVILRWNGAEYKVATNLMRAAPISDGEVDETIAEFKSDPPVTSQDSEKAADAFAKALDWFYSGNTTQANRLLNTLFAATPRGLQLLDEFQKLLDSSPYWQQIKTPRPPNSS